jgi:rubredoxin
MAIRDLLPNRLDGGTRYECGLCTLSFDSDRPNCPACGWEIHKVR